MGPVGRRTGPVLCTSLPVATVVATGKIVHNAVPIHLPTGSMVKLEVHNVSQCRQGGPSHGHRQHAQKFGEVWLHGF